MYLSSVAIAIGLFLLTFLAGFIIGEFYTAWKKAGIRSMGAIYISDNEAYFRITEEEVKSLKKHNKIIVDIIKIDKPMDGD